MAFVQDIYHPLFFTKREIRLVVSTFGGTLFSGDRSFQGLLTPVTFYRYSGKFATFEGSLLSEFYGISKKLFLDQLNAWLNRKLVSGEVLKLLFSVAKKEFKSRHYSILHFLLSGGRTWTFPTIDQNLRKS